MNTGAVRRMADTLSDYGMIGYFVGDPLIIAYCVAIYRMVL